jgi:hypothetical protein
VSFLVVTIILYGGAAAMIGQALARDWRPAWMIVIYVLPLAAADRFFFFALFGAELLSLGRFVVAALILLAVAAASFRWTRARRMVAQYPWLYERAGPFGWRDRRGQC